MLLHKRSLRIWRIFVTRFLPYKSIDERKDAFAESKLMLLSVKQWEEGCEEAGDREEHLHP